MKSKSLMGALLLLAVAGQNILAAPVSFPWSVTVVGGPHNGTMGSGNFSYDDSALDGFGDGLLNPLDGLAVSLTLFGQNFNETNDIDFTAFPQLTVTSFVPVNMDFLINEFDVDNPTPINQPGVISINAQGALVPIAGAGFGQEITLGVVPEPGTWLLATAAVVLFAVKRRSRA